VLASISACIRLKYTVNLINSTEYLHSVGDIVIWGCKSLLKYSHPLSTLADTECFQMPRTASVSSSAAPVHSAHWLAASSLSDRPLEPATCATTPMGIRSNSAHTLAAKTPATRLLSILALTDVAAHRRCTTLVRRARSSWSKNEGLVYRSVRVFDSLGNDLIEVWKALGCGVR